MNEASGRVLTPHGLIVAAALLALVLIVNLAGVRWLARANTAITVWKLAIPAVAAIALIVAGFNSANFTAHGGFAPTGARGVFAAVSAGGVMFSLFGFRTAIDMAGETRNPQTAVPLAIIGAVVISLAIYILLQVAFIGTVPQAHLAHGWSNLSENVAGGPFAAFATILGMQWLAAALYFDAVLSPMGTALAYVGATARINYALARTGSFRGSFSCSTALACRCGRSCSTSSSDSCCSCRFPAGPTSSASSARPPCCRSPSGPSRSPRCATSSPPSRGPSSSTPASPYPRSRSCWSDTWSIGPDGTPTGRCSRSLSPAPCS